MDAFKLLGYNGCVLGDFRGVAFEVTAREGHAGLREGGREVTKGRYRLEVIGVTADRIDVTCK